SVCGGIQPGVLKESLSAQQFSAGLPARILFACPNRVPKEWTEDDIDEGAEKAYRELVEGLTKLEMGTDGDAASEPLALALTPEAKAVWVAFYNRFAQRQAEVEGDVAAAFSKLEAYAARLALVHHVCESVIAGGDATAAVGAPSVRAGIALAEWF